MKNDELTRLARFGAAARLAELDRERAALLRVFPGLRAVTVSGGAVAVGQKRRGMSAAARRAVSVRMKKYWAARRKAKAAKA